MKIVLVINEKVAEMQILDFSLHFEHFSSNLVITALFLYGALNHQVQGGSFPSGGPPPVATPLVSPSVFLLDCSKSAQNSMKNLKFAKLSPLVDFLVLESLSGTLDYSAF